MSFQTLENQQIQERAVLESKHREEREQAERTARAAHDARLAAEQEAQAKERREAEEAALMDRLRTNFFAANANATDDDWTKAKDRIKEDHMIAQSRIDPVEVEAGALVASRPNDYRTW